MPHSLNDDTIKISILGAGGGIGQSLSLLLKTQLHYQLLKSSNSHQKHIHLSLYDVNQDAINGVTADLSHIDTPVTVSNHSPATPGGIRECLINTDLILIPAGVPRKPGMNREDLFNINAKIVMQLSISIAEFCDLSKVFILVISNPVNSLVPVMVEKLYQYPESKNSRVENRIFGITNLDIVRASTFLHELTINSAIQSRSNNMPRVPVIGGHSGDTIMPLFSMAQPSSPLSLDQLKHLVNRVQYGGDEVVKAKNGLGSATLSMAHAAYKVVTKFVSLLVDSTDQIDGIFYVSLKDHAGNPICPSAAKLLPLIDNCPYFSVPVSINNRDGIVAVDYDIINRMSSYERDHMLPLCLSKLQNSIKTGKQTGSAT